MPAGRTTVAYDPTLYDENGNYIGLVEEAIPPPDYNYAAAEPYGGGGAIPPPDTTMYAAPVEAQYQPGGENYVAPYAPPSADPGYVMGPSTGDPAVQYAQSQPTDPYNTAPSGTYPSDPIPEPAPTLPGGIDRDAFMAGRDRRVAASVSRYAAPGIPTPAGNWTPTSTMRPSFQEAVDAVNPFVKYGGTRSDIMTLPPPPTIWDSTDKLGAFFGLEPDPSRDPGGLDMANQLSRNFTEAVRDPLGGLAEAVKFAPRYAQIMVGNPLKGLGAAAPVVEGLQGNALNALRDLYGVGEDVLGPAGIPLRAIQSNTDPVGSALGAVRDALGAAKDDRLDPAVDWWQAGPGVFFDTEYQQQREAAVAEMARRRALGEPVADSKEQAALQTLRDMEQSVGAVTEPAATVVQNDPNLNRMSAQALAAVASNPNTPAPIKAEAGRLIGANLAAQLGTQPLPWYQGGLDTLRRGAQAVRNFDIPTPDLSGASVPAVDIPSFGIPSLGFDFNISDIPTPSLSMPATVDSASVAAQEAADSVPGRGIPASVLAAASKNVIDPLIANSQDTRIFGVDTTGRGIFDLPSIPTPAGFDLPRSIDGPDVAPLPDWRPSLPTADVESGIDRLRTIGESVVGTVGDAAGSLTEGGPRLKHTVTRPAGTIDPETAAAWKGMQTADLAAMLANNPDQFNASVTAMAVPGTDGTPRKVWVIPGMIGPNGEPYIVGVVKDGVTVPTGDEMSDAAFLAVLDAADATPVSGDSVPSPDAAAATNADAAKIAADTGTGLTLEDVAIPAPDSTSGGSPRSSAGWDEGAGDWSSSRSSGRRSSWDDSGEGFDAGVAFTADDFLDAAGGNRRRAEMMARFANRRRRRGQNSGAEMSGMWPGFPFGRPPSPIRANILASLGEAFAQAFPNRRATP